jgi:perosamine synthetase
MIIGGQRSAPALLGGTPVRSKPFPKHTTMLDEAEKSLVLEVLNDGELSGFSGRPGPRFLGGPFVQRLEREVAAYFGVRHAVSFNSATSALHGTIAAAGIGPGDEVITSAFSMSSSASCVLMNNAIPVFADIEPRTFCLDPISVERRITSRTRAILTVNLYGHPSSLQRLGEIADARGLMLIEDNAQAAGARFNGRLAGTFGRMGVLSLNYHKAIQCGEGGLVITNDDELALRCQLIRNHGEVVAPDIGRGDLENQLGWNYRLSELGAAVAIPQFGKLERLVAIRRELSTHLTELLTPFGCLEPPTVIPGCTHTFYLFAITFDEAKAGLSRAAFARAMAAEGLPLNIGYVKPLYLQTMYQKRLAYTKGCPFTCGHYDGDAAYQKGLCPVTEEMHEKRLLISDICKYPNTTEDLRDFATAVEKVLDHADALGSGG